MSQLPYNPETLQLSAIATAEANTSAIVPTHQSGSYLFNSHENKADFFSADKFKNRANRIQNPLTDIFEKRIAALHGGVGAIALSSGHAAQLIALTNILKAGDNFVFTSPLYSYVGNQFQTAFKRLGIEARFSTIPHLEEKIDSNTKAIYLEADNEREINIADFDAFVKLAQHYDLPLIVNNTFGAVGALFKPIEHGANVVVEAAGKWIGDAGSSTGGVIVDGGNYNWNNGKFSQFTAPVKRYNNLNFWELFGSDSSFGNIAFIVRARIEGLTDSSIALSPFNCFLLLQGLETLSSRVSRHTHNALLLAQWLEGHRQVEYVNYPGLESSPHHQNAKRYLRNGFGNVLSFRVKGSKQAAALVVDKLRVAGYATKIGISKTVVVPSTSFPEFQQNEEQLTEGSDSWVRIAVGIEHFHILKTDFEHALESIETLFG